MSGFHVFFGKNWQKKLCWGSLARLVPLSWIRHCFTEVLDAYLESIGNCTRNIWLRGTAILFTMNNFAEHTPGFLEVMEAELEDELNQFKKVINT